MLDVGSKAPLHQVDRCTIVGVLPENTRPLLTLDQQRARFLQGQLIGREVVGNIRLDVPGAEERSVAADPDLDGLSLSGFSEGDGADLTGIDRLYGILQAHRQALITEVETAKTRTGLVISERDLVELFLHVCGELIVHQPPEVPFQEACDRKRREGRNEGVALLEDVLATKNGVDDGGIGRGTADPSRLHLLDQ